MLWSPNAPETLHVAPSAALHARLARRIVRPRTRGCNPTLQNAAMSALTWNCAAIPAAAAVTWLDRTTRRMAWAAAVLLLYHSMNRQVTKA